MATATPPDKENREDNFQLELSRVRKEIESVFAELIDCLQSRKKHLFDQLNDILIRYQSYKRETDELSKQKVQLEKLSLQNQGQFSGSVKSVHNKIMKLIDDERKTIVMPARPKLVRFVCDKNKLVREVNELCKLVERVSEIDYKSKTQSVISVCDGGTGNEQLNCPFGVTVDHNTGNIYVADFGNDCVKVFDNTAKYLFKFGDEKGEGKMSHPRGLLIRGNQVFVSHSDSILVYQLDGKFVSSIGSKGSGELQFNYPRGLSTDEYNNDIYICDRNNHRIKIISENLQFKSQFGKDTLHYPRDIKHYKDNIFILDQSNPCLHIYNRDLVLQQSVVTSGIGQQVIDPWFFFIDNFGNILITDYGSDSILILNLEFEFIHKISVSLPTGITIVFRSSSISFIILLCTDLTEPEN